MNGVQPLSMNVKMMNVEALNDSASLPLANGKHERLVSNAAVYFICFSQFIHLTSHHWIAIIIFILREEKSLAIHQQSERTILLNLSVENLRIQSVNRINQIIMYPRQQQQQHTMAAQPQQTSWTSSGRHSVPPPVHYPPPRPQSIQQQPISPAYSPVPMYRGKAPELHRPPPMGTRQPPQIMSTREQPPALVSPKAQNQATAVSSSPRTPKSMPSSTHTHNAVTPLSNNASAAAAASIDTANMITSKPPRPYTEYTMFYQLEREYILHCVLPKGPEDEKKNTSATSPGGGQMALFENDPLMPAKYRSLPLRADWYISGKSKKPTKRKHRKSHGKIGFLELTRMIASRWSKVDDETRKYCKMMAAMELVKYKEDMESYNLYKDQLSAIGQIPHDMKERIMKKKIAQQKKEANAKGGGGRSSKPAATKKRSRVTTTRRARSTIKADPVVSSNMSMTRMPPILPSQFEPTPLSRASPIQRQGSTLNDNDMEQFITSLVRSPNRPSTAKTITPDRSLPTKRRRLFRDKSTGSTAASAAGFEEMIVPLKTNGGDDEDHLDGIKMTFSGIDENEIAREFSQHVHRETPVMGAQMTGAPPMGRAPSARDPSFDYWDALVGL